MRKTTRRRAIAPLVIGVWWVQAASPTTVWWTLGGTGLAIVATATVASLLVLHFHWRKHLMHRMRAEQGRTQDLRHDRLEEIRSW